MEHPTGKNRKNVMTAMIFFISGGRCIEVLTYRFSIQFTQDLGINAGH